MKNLIDQINNATAKELAGYKPAQDHQNRSILELLETIDELADEIRENQAEAADLCLEISGYVSMIRTKLGFPASFHTTALIWPLANNGEAA